MWQHSGMSAAIDHVIFCVDDLDRASVEIDRKFQLNPLSGGRHAGHGTANRIVPLGSSYLEMIAVVDPVEASKSFLGNWVGMKATDDLEAHALCIRTDDLDSVCGRLGLDPVSMSRMNPDGAELRWRLAALEDMISRGLPFYIEWDIEPSDHPGRAGAPAEASIEVTLTGDRDLLAVRTAGTEGVSIEPGEPGISAVTVRFPGHVVRL